MKYQVKIIFTGKFYQTFKLYLFNLFKKILYCLKVSHMSPYVFSLILSLPENGKMRTFSQLFVSETKDSTKRSNKGRSYSYT